jgi:hypothetical protein
MLNSPPSPLLIQTAHLATLYHNDLVAHIVCSFTTCEKGSGTSHTFLFPSTCKDTFFYFPVFSCLLNGSRVQAFSLLLTACG